MTTSTFASPVTPEALRLRVMDIIRQQSNNNPRSKVVKIGPSEIGDACLRKLSYKMLEVEKTNTMSDPWPATCGTAVHSWLADAFTADKSGNWLVEHRVTAREGLSGMLDLFDIDNGGMVIDHKCVGATSMKTRKAEGPTRQQIVQLNVYGYGLEQQGYEVSKIALVFYPLGGKFSGIHTWIGDYDRDKAIEAMIRLDDTKNLIAMLDPDENPERWAMIPASSSNLCLFCPWYVPRSEDLSKGCPGGSL